jgi:hypothetical protein
MTGKQRPVYLRLRGAGIPLIAATGIVILVAACGGSSPETNTFAPGATYAQMLAFAKCMRSNGVPQFPDPDRQGNFNNATIRALDTNNSSESNGLFQCRSVLPNAGTGLTVEQVQQDQQQNLRQAVKSASCMRAHGIENFADPSGSTQASGVNWQPVLQAGLNLNTPSYKAAFHACQTRADHIIPPPLAPGAVAPSPPPQGSGSGPSGSPAP